MGQQCCSGNSAYPGEDFVQSILDSPINKLNGYTYLRLLNDIVSKRVRQQVYKKHLKELIIPSFYDNYAHSPTLKYVKAVIENPLIKLDDKNNLYLVVLFYYPLIDHTDEDCVKTLYSLFTFITGMISFKELKDILINYFTLCSKDLNYSLWSIAENIEIAQELNNMNNYIYTQKNIHRVVLTVISDLKTKSEKDFVTEKEFYQICSKYDFSSVTKIRQIIMDNL